MGLKWNEILKGLPDDLLVKFNKMNQTGKQYTLNRILGFTKVDSIRAAGSNAKPEMLSSTAKSLEERNPQIEEIVQWGVEHSLESQLNNEKSAFAKTLEGKKAELEMQQLNHATSVMSPNMADSIDFYKKVATGFYKTRKITERYGADGKLIERKKEVIEDVDAKMRAREKLDRLLGINAIQNLGQVQVGSISINIVDASKKEDDEPSTDFQEDAIVSDVVEGNEIVEQTVIEHEPQVEVEIEKPKKPTTKELREQMDKDFDAIYAKQQAKRAKEKAKRNAK